MSTSKHTFDQVKSILGKLDRSIDDARAKRLDTDHRGPAPVGASAAPAPVAAPLPARPEVAQARPGLAQPRPLRATPNYGTNGAAFNGRADHKSP